MSLTKLNRRDEAARDPANPEPGYFLLRKWPDKTWVPAIILYEPEGWALECDGVMIECTPEPSLAVLDCWCYGRRLTLEQWLEFKRGYVRERKPFGIGG